jgi:NodT family efflux transporter outer membrane factor (OMF) lipoprotein
MKTLFQPAEGSGHGSAHAYRCVLAVGSILLAGCAAGPDYHRPAVSAAESYAPAPLPSATAATEGEAGSEQTFSPARDISAQWWTLFQSPELNTLIQRAYAANPTIEAALATLKQAQENVYAQRGFYFPTIQTTYNRQYSKLSGNTASASQPGIQGNGENITQSGPAEPLTYTFHTAQLTVGFTPDVFGGNRRQVESLQAQADAARYQLEAAYVTLASNVVAAAIQEASDRAQIAAARAIVDANTRLLEIVREQVRLGSATGLDLAAQESALAQARQLLPSLEKQLEQTRDLLRVLAGDAPDHDLPEAFGLASLHLPEELPLTLPSRLIAQRPDVLAAEEQMHAASAQVGVAVANRLPQFAITANAGGNAAHLSQMFWGSGTFWDLTGNISQTLFAGGSLRHHQLAAEQALVQAAAQYRGTVLTAFQNVADTLHALYADADALKAAAAAERAATQSLAITRKQCELGSIPYTAVLTAEQTDQQARLGLIQAQAARLTDTAALFQALGGGWWNRQLSAPDQPAPPPGRSAGK